ncbi:Hypothetical predicted protein [Mytilus galloprovincialis]|uniref:Uncharacterized protein n=1 Tax=Mytilus galloprovincialis TaxID=29158 RepID=A0A8B6C2U6_MYTGA|nr:Hypothetical predicted protein [Mytilus galloprovincialis]
MIISIDSNTEKYKINGTEASILTIDGGVGTDAKSDDGRIFEKDVLERLSSILPKVISNLRDVGELNSFVQFNELLASGSFPFENIAYRLFCDVVQWYTLSNTSSMRYSELVKRFWRTGYKLFKGKFLRFMSGLKNTGNINEGMSERGKYEPMNSELNFAVPSWSVLDKMITPVSTETFRPGLIDTMINISHENDPDKIATFKLCVDGKKINSSTIGNLGDVNLWGHEDPPTLSSKMKQLDEDKNNIEQLRNLLQDIQSERIESILDCAQHIKPVFIEHCINTIQAIGHKIRDLRKAKVGKHMAYDKFLKTTEGDWRKSRYAFVISSLKTSLFEISSCIEDALSCIDKLGCITAEMRGLRNLYCEGKVLDLNRQDNFYCLQIQNDKSDVSDSSIVKQRSDAWHKIRNTAHVTGSTCNKALGLETFKKATNALQTGL